MWVKKEDGEHPARSSKLFQPCITTTRCIMKRLIKSIHQGLAIPRSKNAKYSKLSQFIVLECTRNKQGQEIIAAMMLVLLKHQTSEMVLETKFVMWKETEISYHLIKGTKWTNWWNYSLIRHSSQWKWTLFPQSHQHRTMHTTQSQTKRQYQHPQPSVHAYFSKYSSHHPTPSRKIHTDQECCENKAVESQRLWYMIKNRGSKGILITWQNIDSNCMEVNSLIDYSI